MPNFRRGVEHIDKANESKGSGDFKPFMPNLYWKDDGQERYVLILNPVDEIPMVKMQKPFTSEGRVELVISRTDEAIGERKDPLEETWGYPATDLNVCIAVELEPEFEVVKGRKRPTGFIVKTRTFERKLRDDKDEPTGEKEEVTAPVVGVIAQSPSNFFNHVASQDANVAPIHETAALIRRVGDDKNTDYEVELFDRMDLDLGPLIDHIDSVSYLGDDLEDLIAGLEDAEDDFQCAAIIGSTLLDKWLNELATDEHYQSVFEAVDQVARYPKKGWKKSGAKAKEEREEPVRQTRTSSRRRKQEDEAPVGADDNLPDSIEADQAADPPAAEEEAPAPKAKRASRAKPKEKAGDKAAEDVSKGSPVRERLAALQARAEAKKAAAAA